MRGFEFNPGGYLLSHPRFEGSTIGGRGLNGRIRNGNGCDPSPMTTGNLLPRLKSRDEKIQLHKGKNIFLPSSSRYDYLLEQIVKPNGQLVPVS